MRLRNIKNKEEILSNSSLVVKDPTKYKGKWQELFQNNNPIHLEIGTGKCKFIKENARTYPNINFIGVEKSASILALGIKNETENIPNLKLISYDASEIDQLFYKEISTIYLNFSDPWPKKRHARRRLTHRQFLEKYDSVFKNKKIIIQKTDNASLFEFSLTSLSEYGYTLKEVKLDLQNEQNSDNIMTEYETKFSKIGKQIYLLKAEKD